jgi:betaine-aldehyde dehydrogenase
MTRNYDLWIDGAWVKAHGNAIDRISPAHGDLLATYAEGSAADVDRAVTAARRAFDAGAWVDLACSRKAALLNAWADLIVADIERLAVIEAEESGKPIRFARGEVEAAVDLTRFAAALVMQLKGDTFSNLGADAIGFTMREPRGVVGLIVPWNYPIVTLMQKLPFALAAGCSTVIKPSEMTSGTALEVAALAEKAGLPLGLINVVTGYGAVVGEALSTHDGVDMISFTGSTQVGKRIARNQAERVGRVGLELGGKGANIVFADADIDTAVDGVLFGMILNQGEECCAGARLLIDEAIAESFVSRLVQSVARVRIGLPLDETSDMGAMISPQHAEDVLRHIAAAQKEGCKLMCGGGRLTEGPYTKGFFIEPTIFTGVEPRHGLFQYEVFGPVLSVSTFRTEDEAVDLANATKYGLANGFWSKDIGRVHRVARRLRCGTVFVNTYLESVPQLPFGGQKQSGIGRELGMEGLLEFTEIKSVFVKVGARDHALPHTH